MKIRVARFKNCHCIVCGTNETFCENCTEKNKGCNFPLASLSPNFVVILELAGKSFLRSNYSFPSNWFLCLLVTLRSSKAKVPAKFQASSSSCSCQGCHQYHHDYLRGNLNAPKDQSQRRQGQTRLQFLQLHLTIQTQTQSFIIWSLGIQEFSSEK